MRSEFSEILLDTDILQRAAVKLDEKLCRNPEDVESMTSLGEIYRKLGMLEKAAEMYGKICNVSTDNRKAKYLQTLLAGERLARWPTDEKFIPPQFTQIKNYLSAPAHEELLSFVSGIESEFNPSTVLSGYFPEVSKSFVYYIRNEFYEALREQLVAGLPTICERLQIKLFSAGYISLEIKAYKRSDYFRPHSDRYTGGNRRINFGCVFYFTPKRFSGGDFLLFDTDFEGQNYLPTRFTRFIPEDNCAIFYPSDSYHSVVPVMTGSDRFSDSRFAIIGHIEESTNS